MNRMSCLKQKACVRESWEIALTGRVETRSAEIQGHVVVSRFDVRNGRDSPEEINMSQTQKFLGIVTRDSFS